MVATDAERRKSAKPNRAQRRREKNGRPPPPPETRGYVLAESPSLPPLIPLETLPPGMVLNREWLHAWAASRRFESWLRVLCARYSIPMDCAGRAVELLTIYVEAELLARIKWPNDYIRADFTDADEDYPATEDDAIAHGLTIVAARPKRDRAHATLPGCQWANLSGAAPCLALRAYGERFCPHHANDFLKMMRGDR